MDTTVVTVVSLTVTGATLGVLSPEATETTLFLLVPLIGTILVSGIAFLLNPEIETRKITMGRTLFGFLVGVPGPWALISLLKYWSMNSLADFFALPPLLALTGAAAATVAYVLSRPLFANAYERAGIIAKREVTRLERMTAPKERDADREEGK
jgi:hypothetical protein